MISEFKLLEKIRKKIPASLRGGFSIEDDAAIVRNTDKKNLLMTTDLLVDGVDFKLKSARPELIGRKSIAVNLSDIAAMGGTPLACLVGLGIPAQIKPSWVERFYAGLTGTAKKYNTFCVGGDISKSRTLFVSVSVLATAGKRGSVLRNGARPGNWIGVTGKLGGSLAGRHFRFEPRIREGLFIVKHAAPTSMIDISDGLAQDLQHILRQSRVDARLDVTKIPVSAAAFHMAKGDRANALRRALSDGEDFELLFTVPDEKKRILEKKWRREFPRVSLSWIGRIQKGKGRIFWVKNGERVADPVGKKKGYAHFD